MQVLDSIITCNKIIKEPIGLIGLLKPVTQHTINQGEIS